MTLTTITTTNTRSLLTPRWGSRSTTLAGVLEAGNPSFIVSQEEYAAFRPTLTRKLPDYQVAVAHKGKVIRYKRDRWSIVTGSVRRYSLGDGKHACAAELRHRAAGVHVVVVSAHLLNKAKNGAKRRRQLAKLLTHIAQDYDRALPVLLGADLNAEASELSNVYAGTRRYGSARYDLPANHRRGDTFDTYQGFRRPPARHWPRGEHIDVVLLRFAYATQYAVLTHPWPWASDHWPVQVTVELGD